MLPLLHLGPNLYIPTYFVWASVTYSLCLIYLAHRAERLEMPRKLALDLAFIVMIGGFIGARLFSVFYEEWPFYRKHPLMIFEFWHGGFVFYGGLLGALLAGAIALRIRREKFWPWADFFAPILALGYGVGRIGCLLAGCCYGKPCHLPWAITFHYPWLPKGPRQPTEIYASISGFIVFIILTRFEKEIRARADRPTTMPDGTASFDALKSSGYLFSVWLVLHAIGRIIMEHYRADWRGPDIMGLSISTVISIFAIIFAVTNLIRLERRSQKIT